MTLEFEHGKDAAFPDAESEVIFMQCNEFATALKRATGKNYGMVLAFDGDSSEHLYTAVHQPGPPNEDSAMVTATAAMILAQGLLQGAGIPLKVCVANSKGELVSIEELTEGKGISA